MNVRKRVARGVELLDEVYPGWENRINTGRLDIGCRNGCIVGQLWGRFDQQTVESRMGIRFFSTPKYGIATGVLVFGEWRRIALWEEMTEEWRRVIWARRRAARRLAGSDPLEREHRLMLQRERTRSRTRIRAHRVDHDWATQDVTV